MEKKLILEIERMKSLFGEERLYGNLYDNEEKIDDIENKLVSLNENKVLLNEQVVSPSRVMKVWKSFDDLLNLKSTKTGFKQSTIRELIGDLDNVLKNSDEFISLKTKIDDIISDAASAGNEKQSSKDDLVNFFTNGTISSSVESSWNKTLDELPLEIKEMEIKDINPDGTKNIGNTVIVGEELKNIRNEMVNSYREFEERVGRIIDEPQKYGIDSEGQMQKFADDFEANFSDEIPLNKKVFVDTFSLGNVRTKTKLPKWMEGIRKDYEDFIREMATNPTIQKIKAFFEKILKFYRDYMRKFIDNVFAAGMIDRKKSWDEFFEKYVKSSKTNIAAKIYNGISKNVMRYVHICISIIHTTMTWHNPFIQLARRLMRIPGEIALGANKNFTYKFINKILNFLKNETIALIITLYTYWPFDLQIFGWQAQDRQEQRDNLAHMESLIRGLAYAPQDIITNKIKYLRDKFFKVQEKLMDFFDKYSETDFDREETKKKWDEMNERYVNTMKKTGEQIEKLSQDTATSLTNQYNDLKANIKKLNDCIKGLSADKFKEFHELTNYNILPEENQSLDQTNEIGEFSRNLDDKVNSIDGLLDKLLNNGDMSVYDSILNQMNVLTGDVEDIGETADFVNQDGKDIVEVLKRSNKETEEALGLCDKLKKGEEVVKKEKEEVVREVEGADLSGEW